MLNPMIKSGKLNILKLKVFVQQRQLMLYPLLLFACLNLANESKNRYHLCYEFDGKCFFYAPYQEDFEAFYQRYLHNFLHSELHLKIPQNVLRVCLSEGIIAECENLPQVEILSADKDDELLISTLNLPDDFLLKLQLICDDFGKLMAN